MNQRFDEETLLWLEEEPSHGTSHGKKIAAMAGGGIVGTALLGKALGPVAKRLARKTGMPQGQIQMLLTAAAPMVISAVSAAVAKRKQAGREPYPPGSRPSTSGRRDAKSLLGAHRRR
ncbi:DUF937 domain-containing protein [Actinocorallia sp. API 0066]|uniref:DUF937 domain-containing protein n=1 Tax=Actinocorallia sp. API 0066 TaxID=2896846 RepID=UPI001E5A5AEE|nr:DUF937 domain-containing protein [Actinocorallia sp. API 0066]MCD0452173.1 DUF937 domain-containing protein [Actinocorallia sp. API 0066]